MAEFIKLDETAFLETPEQREAYLAAARELSDPELLGLRPGSKTEVCDGAVFMSNALPKRPFRARCLPQGVQVVEDAAAPHPSEGGAQRWIV